MTTALAWETPPLFEPVQPSLLAHTMTRDPEPIEWESVERLDPALTADLIAKDIHNWRCNECEYNCDSERSARWHEVSA